MNPSLLLLDYLKAWEAGPGGGPALRAYKDSAGVWTIGYGKTREVVPGMTCTESQADRWLEEEVEYRFNGVEMACENDGLLQHHLDSLTSLAYNIGMSKFRGSSPCLLARKGLIEKVGPAIELWNKITLPDGRLVTFYGLVRRRAGDRAIFDKADYGQRP